jgi:hypothetical protein
MVKLLVVELPSLAVKQSGVAAERGLTDRNQGSGIPEGIPRTTAATRYIKRGKNT